MAWPAAQCCPPGAVVSVTGQCCPPGSKPDPKSGQCGPPTFSCPPGQLSKIDNICCPSGQVPNNVIGGCCPPGQIPDPVTGICKQTACAVPPNTLVNGKCCSPDDLKQGGACWNCGPGKTPVGPNNFCCDDSKVYTDASGAKACCLSGVLKDGQCMGGTPMQPGCSPSSTDPNCCASGYKPTGNTCCLESQLTTSGVCCPAGQKPGGPNKDQCQPLHTGWIPGWPDGDGTHDGWKIPKIPDGGCIGPGCFTLKICCASGLIPTADNKSCCAPHLMTVFGTCCSAGNPPNPKTGLCTTTVKVASEMFSGLYPDSRRLLLPQSFRQPGRKNLRARIGRPAGHSRSGHRGLRSQHAQGSRKRIVCGGYAAGPVPLAEPDGRRPLLFSPRDCRGAMRTEAAATDMRAQSSPAWKYLRGHPSASNSSPDDPPADSSSLIRRPPPGSAGRFLPR